MRDLSRNTRRSGVLVYFVPRPEVSGCQVEGRACSMCDRERLTSDVPEIGRALRDAGVSIGPCFGGVKDGDARKAEGKDIEGLRCAALWMMRQG